MKIQQSLIITAATYIIAIPAFAQIPTNPSSIVGNSQTQPQMQKDFKMTKKDFVAQIEKSFDSMDKNHDGVLTMDELSGGKSGMMQQPPAVLTPSPVPATAYEQQKTTPAQSTKSLAPATGIAPIGR